MKHLKELQTNQKIFFGFMREKYPVYYNSNIFFRDIQYAIKSYFETKNIFINYAFAEKLALEFILKLEEQKELIKLSKNSWLVNFKFEESFSEVEV